MKKIIAVILALLLACGSFALADESLAGGWNTVDNGIMSGESINAFDKAMEGFVGVGYTPVALLATQVVAGINYCFLCEATPVVPDPQSYYALVYIYASVDGTASVLDVQRLDIGVTYNEYTEDPVSALTGSYVDKNSQRAMMFIEALGEGCADVTVSWSNSAFETVTWIFTVFADETGTVLTYENGIKSVVTVNENEEMLVKIEYEDGTGTLTVQDDGTICWDDQKENAGDSCVFEYFDVLDIMYE